MKKTAKVLTSVLAALMLLTLAACSGGGIPDGRYYGTSPGMGRQYLEFSGNNVTINMGMISVNSRYTFDRDNNRLTVTIEGQSVNYGLEIVDEYTLMFDVGIGIPTRFVREGGDMSAVEPAFAEEPPAPDFEDFDRGLDEPVAEEPEELPEIDLNLPLRMIESTYQQGIITVRIARDSVLQSFVPGGWNQPGEWHDIDTDVRSVSLVDNGAATFWIKNDNSLWAMGSNQGGLLGDGTGVDRDQPVHIMDNVAMVTNTVPVYALTTDMRLYTWGSGIFEPENLADGIIEVSEIAHFHGSVVIHASTGQVYSANMHQISPKPVRSFSMSGLNLSAYIDHENTLHRMTADASTFETVASNVESFVALDGNNLRFITQTGTLYGIGNNTNGELGDGTRVPREQPVQIAQNVAHSGELFYLTQTGEMWTWENADPTPRLTARNIEPLANGHFAWFRDLDTVVPRASWRAAALAIEQGVGFDQHELFDNVKIPRILEFDGNRTTVVWEADIAVTTPQVEEPEEDGEAEEEEIEEIAEESPEE